MKAVRNKTGKSKSDAGAKSRRQSTGRKVVSKSERQLELLRKRNQTLTSALAAIKRSQPETIQRERLQALGQMASGIVHDFNNALTPILGASDFLLMNPKMLDQREEAVKLLESIRTSAHDAKNMVSRLREFYRPKEDEEAQSVAVNPLIDEVILLTRPKWREQAREKNITVSIQTDLKATPCVKISESHFREVLMNLIFNSVDAIPESGAISISTREVDGFVIIEVSDTGMGMTDDVRQRCFEPFFSTKGKNGTGMGLASAYGIVRKYHGSIRVARTEIGKGTTVEIRLPASKPREDHPAKADAALPDVRVMSVLVCDNDPHTRQMFAKFLRSDGHRVVLAASGAEACRKIAGGSFDLVMLDAVMPTSNGGKLAMQVKADAPTVKVMLVTGAGESGVEGSQMPEGVDAVLGKPITHSELRRAVAQLA